MTKKRRKSMMLRKLVCFGMAAILSCSSFLQTSVYAQGNMKEQDKFEESREYVTEDSLEEMVTGAEEDIKADNTAEEGYKYKELDDGTLEITGYTGAETELVIPAEIDGKSVTVIGEDAFFECESLVRLELPETVTELAEFSFAECGNLTHVTLPKNMQGIGNFAFWRCENLISVTMPENLSFIGESAFSGCSSLADIVIPDGITTINTCVFIGCSSLKNIVIPENVKKITDYAFENCSGLTSITIPENVTDIGSHAFSGCSNLVNITVDSGNMNYVSKDGLMYNKAMTNIIICPEGKAGTVTIPKSVISLEKPVFWGCGKVTSIEIPESIEDIEDTSFRGCISLENINVNSNNTVYFSEGGVLYEYGRYGRDRDDVSVVKCPEGKVGKVTISEKTVSIKKLAFSGCRLLTDITISNRVSTIGDDAFLDCSGIKSITIPKSVCQIGDEESYGKIPFSGCSSLKSINVESGNLSYSSDDGLLYCVRKNDIDGGGISISGALVRCPEAKAGHIEILESVPMGEIYNIRTGAFSNCTKLTSIKISENICSIYEKIFVNCANLTSMIVPENVEKIADGAFSGCGKDFGLVVQPGSYAENYAKEHGIKYSYCTHTWNTATIKATTKENGTITKICTKCGKKTITTIYATETIKLSKISYTYNGKAQKPTVTIKDSQGKVLSSKKSYTVSYPKTMKNVGSYTITIKFKGNYSGTVKKNFTIVPKGTSISKVTPNKKGFTVKWKKQAVQTTGYEVAYSTDRKFSKKNTKVVLVKKSNTTSKSVDKLKAKKKYYIRIRTYKTVNGKKYFSGWSKGKNVTIKK